MFYRKPRQPRATKLQKLHSSKVAGQEDDGKHAAGHAHTGCKLLTGTCYTLQRRRIPSWAASAVCGPCPAQQPGTQRRPWTQMRICLVGAAAHTELHSNMPHQAMPVRCR